LDVANVIDGPVQRWIGTGEIDVRLEAAVVVDDVEVAVSITP
jgi:hypothetical protein